MNKKALITGGVFWLQALLYPLFLQGWPHLTASWSLLILLALCLVLSLAAAKCAPLITSGLALILAVVMCIGHLTLLPLAVAQVGLAFLLGTQKLAKPIYLTGWLLQVFFMQILIAQEVFSTITAAMLIDFGLVALGFLISVWANKLPPYADAVLLILLAGLGFWSQHLSLIAGLVLVICAVGVSSQKRDLPPAALASGALICELAICLTRLHG